MLRNTYVHPERALFQIAVEVHVSIALAAIFCSTEGIKVGGQVRILVS